MSSENEANKPEAVLLTALGFVYYFVCLMISSSLKMGEGVIQRLGRCLLLSS